VDERREGESSTCAAEELKLARLRRRVGEPPALEEGDARSSTPCARLAVLFRGVRWEAVLLLPERCDLGDDGPCA
jgi:hypothetical protein